MNKKVLRWNFIFQYGYVLTNIFNSILLLPLYLINIDAATLGIWLATGNILAWITMVDPGVGDVLQQRIAELRGKKMYQEVSKTIGAGFVASGIIFFISIIVGYIFYLLIDTIIDKNISQYANLEIALGISIVATGLSLVSFSMSGINQGLHNAANVAISSLLANFLFLFVNLAFLYLGTGVLSIAIANLARSIFIVLYNLVSMLGLLKKINIPVWFDWSHFRKFIRIFSFTSASRIISGISSNIDLIILARFIAPQLITVFEINKRPIKITQSLIGRHSVALMPLISHARGTMDHHSIVETIRKQFRYYAHAALFISFLFYLIYKDLIGAWTGPGQYAGDTILVLLIANFFFATIGYFMSNIGYALGDIKRNSLVNIIRGLTIGTLLIFVAPRYGITGTLMVSLCVIILTDFFYFTYRLKQLTFIEASYLKKIVQLWIIIIPLGLLSVWACNSFVHLAFPGIAVLGRLLINSVLFTNAFFLLLFIADTEFRMLIRNAWNKWRLILTTRLSRT